MEQQANGEQMPEADVNPGHEEDPKPDPKKSYGVRFSENGFSNEHNTSNDDENKGTSSSKSKKSVRWSEELVMESSSPSPPPPSGSTPPSYGSATSRGVADGSSPFVSSFSPSSSSSYSTTLKDSVSSVQDVLGRWGKKVGEATKKAEDLAGNTWQHLKTAPSFADAAMGRIAQGTKVLAEGGYEKIFRQTFETVPEEQLLNSYACYLSTSAGPVIGFLYVSTAKLAFCSDNPLPYKAGDKDEWSYYKVIIPFHQLKAVNPSTSRANPAEKYIQVISVDNHEFWYMSFLYYDSAVKCLRDALDARNLFV